MVAITRDPRAWDCEGEDRDVLTYRTAFSALGSLQSAVMTEQTIGMAVAKTRIPPLIEKACMVTPR